MKKHTTKNEKETLALAKILLNDFNNNVFALTGNLGSGKTTFTKGLGKSLKIKETILSPTFNIMRVYNIPINKKNKYKYLCHIDAYRLQSFDDLKDLGINNYFKSPETLTIIEWADKIKGFLPKNTVFIDFKIGKKETERIIYTTVPKTQSDS